MSGTLTLAHPAPGAARGHPVALVTPANAPSLAVLGRLGFGFETMMRLPGSDKALQLMTLALNKDT